MRVPLAGLLLTGCMHVARPAIYVKHDGAPLLPVTAVLVLPAEVRDRIDPIGTNTDVAFATGDAVAHALEQACLATFRDVRFVESAGDVPGDAQVVLEARGTALQSTIEDGELKAFDLFIDATLSLNGNDPLPLAFKKHVDRVAKAEILEQVVETELGPHVESAGAKLAARLRQVVKLPLPMKRRLTQADVMNVVKSRIYAVKSCVDAQKRLQPGVSGKLVMRWRILPGGETAEVQVQSKELEGTPIAECVTTEITGWRFPPSVEELEPIVFPFKF